MFTMRDFYYNPAKYHYNIRYAWALATAENAMYLLLGVCIGVIAASC